MSYSKVFTAWLVGSLFYLYQYIQRTFPGFLSEEIKVHYKMNAEEYSLVAALLWYTYSMLQIPIGILLDRVGVRKIIVLSILICFSGSMLFIISDIKYIAYIGRLLVGVGAASAFMSATKVVVDYLPAGKRGLLTGLTLTIGSIAPFINTYLFYNLHEVGLSWHQALLYITYTAVPLAILAFFTFPKNIENTNSNLPFKETLALLKSSFSNSKIITYAILGIALYTPLAVVGDSWGTQFIVKKYNIKNFDASRINNLLYLGMAVGSVLISWFFEKRNMLDEGIKYCSLLLIVPFGFLLLGPTSHPYVLNFMVFSIGFLTGAEMLCFSAACNYANSNNTGIVIGIINTFNTLAGAIFNQLIGITLDTRWQGGMKNIIRDYSENEYMVALSPLLVTIILSSILAFYSLRRNGIR